MRSWADIDKGRGERNVCGTLRKDFMCKLQEVLGYEFERFESLDRFERASFVLGNELWEDGFSYMPDYSHS